MQQNIHQLQFHGKTGEYFKIWIVNIALSIVTLGIYSAWAKVRTRKYFYNNTLLINSPFDYLADPVKILKGRILAFAILILYTYSPMISPLLQGILMLVIIFLIPWVIIKSLKFNLYNTAYKNIRFHFSASYLTALKVFVGLPLLVGLSIGLAYPYFAKERKKFVIDNSAFGTSQFSMQARTGQFYAIYLKAIAMVLLVVLFVAGIYLLVPSFMPTANNPQNTALPVIIFLMSYPLFMLIYGYIYTNIANLVIDHTTIQQSQFQSHLEPKQICWIYFSNTVAIMVSLGLLIPWAKIRISQYRISCLSLVTDQDLDVFLAAEAEQMNAVGEEVGDLLDIDIGL